MKFSIEAWHSVIKNRDVDALDTLLADDATMFSPVVWTPQEGKHITKLYLTAALEVFASKSGDFTYVREVENGKHFILEFTTTIDGITVNGVDMIELNEAGKIQSFKVMVRPLKAMHKVHEKMGEMLQRYSS